MPSIQWVSHGLLIGQSRAMGGTVSLLSAKDPSKAIERVGKSLEVGTMPAHTKEAGVQSGSTVEVHTGNGYHRMRGVAEDYVLLLSI